MLEALIQARYLSDDAVDAEELHRRLEQYFRGARKSQVKLRSTLKTYPVLQRFIGLNEELASNEEEELRTLESTLTQKERKKRHWAGLDHGLRSVAESVGLGADYALQYSIHSGWTHGTRVWNVVQIDETGGSLVRVQVPNGNDGVWLGADAIRYLCWIAVIGRDVGVLKLDRAAERILDSYRDLLGPIDLLIANGVFGSGVQGSSGP